MWAKPVPARSCQTLGHTQPREKPMNPSRDQLFVIAVIGAVACGLTAGLLFAFSNFVMRALLQQPPESGMRTMQAVNSLIQNPVFFVLFFGAALSTLFLAATSALHLSRTGSTLLLLGSLLYLVGTFAVTVAFNVPLNNSLSAYSAVAFDAAQFWQNYVAQWLKWNHIRTITSVSATVLLTWAAALVAQAPKA
jgi:uncharacterized membrane protein